MEKEDWLEDDVGVIYWAEEFKTWGLFIKDIDGNQCTETQYFPYKKEAMRKSDEYRVRNWEVGKKAGGFSLIRKR